MKSKRLITTLIAIAAYMCCATANVCAQEEKSFAKQMNELKRSSNYVYAEATAESEDKAKSLCNELLLIEVTKYLATLDDNASSRQRIIKDLSAYLCQYLTQERGEVVRVFGYIAKDDISSANESKDNKPEAPTPQAAPIPEGTSTPQVEPQDTPAPSAAPKAATQPAPATEPGQNRAKEAPKAPETSYTISTDGLQLVRWQQEMLQSVVDHPAMAEAKRTLNRYRAQNRVKRVGDNTVSNPRISDTFYLIYAPDGALLVFLAPGDTSERYDMLSGSTVNINDYADNKHIWFQISK